MNLAESLRGLGFTRRTANALAYGGEITSPDDLLVEDFGEAEDRSRLHGRLALLPNLGAKGLAEVLAYRAHGEPAHTGADYEPSIGARIPAELKAKLTAWAESRGVTQAAAIRRAIELLVQPPAEE